MAMRTLTTLFGGAMVVTIGLMLQGCPDQPEIKCLLARGPFMARFDVVSKSDPDETRCPNPIPRVTTVGVEEYFPANGRLQDLDHPSVALKIEDTQNAFNVRATGICGGGYGLSPKHPEYKTYSLGALNSPEPAGRFCTVASMTLARIDFDGSPELKGAPVDSPPAEELPGTGICPDPAEPGDEDAGTDSSSEPEAGDPDAASGDDGAAAEAGGETDSGEADAAEPAPCSEPPPGSELPAIDGQDTTYEWSNVRFVVTPSIIGHAFDGDLTVSTVYTSQADPSATRQCTYKYKVNALYYYKRFDPNALCARVCEKNHDVGPADDKYCDDKPDPEAGFPLGSQINPDLPVKCDPEFKYCVLAKDVKDF